MARATVAVAFDQPARRNDAEALAERLELPLATRFRDPHDLHLTLAKSDRLELRVNAPDHPLAGGHPVVADPLALDTTSPAGRKLNQPLFKAVGVRKGNPFRPAVLDATAGLGEDTWLLAAAGCKVIALERHPVVHALLDDALRRAAEEHPDIASRIELRLGNLALGTNPVPRTPYPEADTIYLDPMFPPGRKTVEKKPMRVLRWLVGDDADADALLAAALDRKPHRVVVKRPRHAEPLAGPEPSHTHDAGKALRFDVYVHA